MLRLLVAIGLLWGVVGGSAGANEAVVGELSAEQKQALPRFFGFEKPEIFKVGDGIEQLRSADLNGDGLLDLLMVNNRRSRIEVFYRRAVAEEAAKPAGKEEEVNELLVSGHYRQESISVSHRIIAMDVADINGDGHADIVYFGEPPELVVLAGRGDGTWASPVSIRVREKVIRSNALALADFDGDGRRDVALLTENAVLLFAQQADGTLSRPEIYGNGSDSVVMIMGADVNSDGRVDLLMAGSGETPVAVRFQEANGRLGPLVRFRVPGLRSLTPSHREGETTSLYTIESRSGRLKRWAYDPAAAVVADVQWPTNLFAYPFTARATRRQVLSADLTGNGLADLVVTDPDNAQLAIFAQSEGVGFAPGEVFATLMRVQDICAGRLGEQDVLFVLSREEKSIGMSKWTGGRLSFPQPVPAVGTPVTMSAGRLVAGQGDRLVYVSEVPEAGFEVHIQPVETLTTSTQPATVSVGLGKLDGAPTGIRLADANQDGLTDILIFSRFEPLRVVLQQPDGGFELFSGGEGAGVGLVKEANPVAFATADVDGDGRLEILLGQKAFVRALTIRDGRWTVIDQINAPGTANNVMGLSMIPPAAGGKWPRLSLYDRSSGEVHTYARDESGKYEVVNSTSVGTFELSLFVSGQFSGDGREQLLIADPTTFALVGIDLSRPELRETAYFQAPNEESILVDSAPGDLNGDGVADVVVIDGKENQLFILTTGPRGELVPAVRFRVFERNSFRGGRGGSEPRELVVRDMNGDGKDDLAILVHDRLIVYISQ